MPLSREQIAHLEECWKAADVKWSEDRRREQQIKIGEARLRNNGSAVLHAYQEAALDSFSKRATICLQTALSELEKIGAPIDRPTEEFILKRIRMLTSMSTPIQFPHTMPRTQSGSMAAVQQSYSMARERLKLQLDRDAANQLRAARLKYETQQDNPTEHGMNVVHNYNLNAPHSRINQHSIDNSTNISVDSIPDAIQELLRISAGDVEAEQAATNLAVAYPSKDSVAKRLKEWAAAAVAVEGLLEKAHHVLPIIQGWLKST